VVQGRINAVLTGLNENEKLVLDNNHMALLWSAILCWCSIL